MLPRNTRWVFICTLLKNKNDEYMARFNELIEETKNEISIKGIHYENAKLDDTNQYYNK